VFLKELYPNENVEFSVSSNISNIKKIINDYDDVFFFETLNKIMKSKFLLKMKNERQQGSFCNWLFKYENFLKIYNNSYSDIEKDVSESEETKEIYKMTSEERQAEIKRKFFGGV
jgi:hypothetical protein